MMYPQAEEHFALSFYNFDYLIDMLGINFCIWMGVYIFNRNMICFYIMFEQLAVREIFTACYSDFGEIMVMVIYINSSSMSYLE
jgi:hypothetical protein